MRTYRRIVIAAAAVLAAAAVVSGCASSRTSSNPSAATSATTNESNPVGDIPDNQAYVPFTPPQGLFTVSVPEGWARTADGAATIFTDKLNTVRVESHLRDSAPTVESARADELAGIASSVSGYRPGDVTVADRKPGPAVRITYQATSAPNGVTGKTGTDAVERYEFWRGGQEVILTLSGPVGADNVDPWRTITDSLQWR
jgi:hypothetical protein